jgi:hypothetical protein
MYWHLCNWVRIELDPDKIVLIGPNTNPGSVKLKLPQTRNPRDLKSNILIIQISTVILLIGIVWYRYSRRKKTLLWIHILISDFANPNQLMSPLITFVAFSLTFSPFSLQTEEHLLHSTCRALAGQYRNAYYVLKKPGRQDTKLIDRLNYTYVIKAKTTN